MKAQLTDEMDKIFGFGDGYEETCRKMLLAGLEWLDAHPHADPKFRRSPNIYGIIKADNEDAKALSAAIEAGSGGDCTGAMHQAVVSHCLFVKLHSWKAYVAKMSERNVEV
jgi:hypothetical protein